MISFLGSILDCKLDDVPSFPLKAKIILGRPQIAAGGNNRRREAAKTSPLIIFFGGNPPLWLKKLPRKDDFKLENYQRRKGYKDVLHSVFLCHNSLPTWFDLCFWKKMLLHVTCTLSLKKELLFFNYKPQALTRQSLFQKERGMNYSAEEKILQHSVWIHQRQ